MIRFSVLAVALTCSLLVSAALDGILIDGEDVGSLRILVNNNNEVPNTHTVLSTGSSTSSNTATRTGLNLGIPMNPKMPTQQQNNKFDDLLKLGFVLHTIESYQDDINLMLDRHSDNIVDTVHDTFHVPPSTEYYVEVVNGNFMVGGVDKHGDPICRNLYLSGTNKYEFVEAGAGVPFLYDGRLEQRGITGPEVVRRVFEEAHEQKLDFIRFNAFSVMENFPTITGYTIAGGAELDEAMLAGLDYILEQARVWGIRVILVLTDFFADNVGGPLHYMDLANFDPTGFTNDDLKSAFYTSTDARAVFYSFISQLVNRVNTFNGRVYRTDLTILAWDIMNEPRCRQDLGTPLYCSTANIRDFVRDTYAFLKNPLGLNVQQLVTVGTDGFFDDGPYSALYDGVGTGVNPINDYSIAVADFTELCAEVDFCEYNIYPDLWNQENEEWVTAWIAAHSDIGDLLNRPVIIKEFGMQPTTNRKKFYLHTYGAAYDQILIDLSKDGGLRGAAYFQIWVKGTEAIFYTLASGGRFGILPLDPEVHLIRHFSWKAGDLSGRHIDEANCPAGFVGTEVVLAPPNCVTGYVGPECVDVDECLLGLDKCSVNAACSNTVGSYSCECHNGYHGNGKLCFELPISLHKIENGFYTKNTLSCVTGSTLVPYPENAPGWVPDPTGYFDSTPVLQASNRVPVDLLQCKIACTMAEDCTSFYWDPIQGTCILKKNECPYTQTSISGCDPAQCLRPVCSAPVITMCDQYIYQKNSPAQPTEGTYECTRGITYFKKGVSFSTDNANCVAPVVP